MSLSTDKVDMMEGTDRTISVDVDGEFDVPFTITLIAVPISAGLLVCILLFPRANFFPTKVVLLSLRVVFLSRRVVYCPPE